MSNSWRDVILNEFVPQLARLTLVADPDSLLADEVMQDALTERGFEVIEFQDSISFRYLYETSYRPRWEVGESVELVVLIRSGELDLSNLPYDYLKAGRRLAFSLSELFPKLTYNEVAALESGDLDVLFRSQKKISSGNLGENATRDFVLKHVFGISVDLIKKEEDLLAELLRLHLSNQQLPSLFAERLVQRLRERSDFKEWPLQELFSDPTIMLEFLQERWPYYLDQEATQKDKPIYETSSGSGYPLKWPGPRLLPFGQANIRAFVDTLFLEGKLRPVEHTRANRLKDLWVTVGVRHDEATDRQQRLARLLDKLESRLPEATSQYQDWLSFATAWAEVNVLQHAPASKPGAESQKRIQALQAAIDSAFQAWLGRKYRFLATLAPHPPVMVHHIARSMARRVHGQSQEKAALIVVDGLAFDQWLIVREKLADQLPGIRFREGAVFAWIPTVTSVSRQAIFSGNLPLYFPNSIGTTAKEPNLWSVFWENQGLATTAIGYEKALRAPADFDRIDELLTRPAMRVVGLVVDQIDYMMHGITLGMRGLHQQLALWLGDGFLAALLERLWQHGYEIYLTSDHGNIEAHGIGRPSEGSLADVKGERVRIYPNETLRETVKASFSGAIPWSVEGLPPDFFPLLAPDRQAFVLKGHSTVSHGGNLLEEVIVPYVRIERRHT